MNSSQNASSRHKCFILPKKLDKTRPIATLEQKAGKRMRKSIIRLIILSVTTVSLFFVPWLLVWAWIRPIPDTINQQQDQAIGYGFNGIITYVDQNEGEPSFYTAGWHNREQKIQSHYDAYFKIASINKLFVAVAISKLVNEGRISLDQTISEILPSLKGKIANSNEITICMLVQHRSGLPNFTDTPDYWSTPKESAEQNLALITGQSANFEPGEEYEYCNTNYLLLKMIMDEILGYNYFKYIQEKILNPLNISDTHESINEVNIEDVMSGYHIGHDADLKTDDWGMISTAQDIGIFLRSLNTGHLLSNKEREIYASIYEYEHSGWVPGYQSFASYYEDIDAVIINFYSTTDEDLMYWNLAEIINNRIYKIIKNDLQMK